MAHDEPKLNQEALPTPPPADSEDQRTTAPSAPEQVDTNDLPPAKVKSEHNEDADTDAESAAAIATFASADVFVVAADIDTDAIAAAVQDAPDDNQILLPGISIPIRKAPAVRSKSSKNGQTDEPPASTDTLITVERSGGIEILVSMATKGEIDPKNIDIIDICDRFLQAIAAAPKENLRQSGKIIFHASVLLRMKAEQLLIDKIEDLDIGGDDFLDFDDDGSLIYDSNNQPVARQITLADLERALTRRTTNRQVRRRRVTLEQLIEALREAEKLEKEKVTRKPKAVIDMDGYADMKGMDDILELAHDEDIEDVIARIEQILIGYFESGDILSLVALIERLGGRGDWVDAFLAVLFLSNAGKVQLNQDKFYGPLFIARTQMEASA